jgi:hypothetical protein
VKIIFSVLIKIFLAVLTTLLLSIFIHKVVHTFFYVCLISVPLSVLISVIYSLLLNSQQKREIKEETRLLEIFSIILVSSLTTFLFLTLIPLNVDRSFSVWMLNQISNETRSGLVISSDQLKTEMSTFMGYNSGELTRRIREQESLGNIKLEKDKIYLTSRGKFQVFFDRVISKLFSTNKKYAQ